MGYSFDLRDRSVEKGLRRIADEQFKTALDAVAADGPLPPRVHEMRKSVKKLRGLLRLVRPGFDGFRRENDALREAARGLTALREADVNLATLDRLLPGADLVPEAAAALREAVARPPVASSPAPPAAEALALFGDRMQALRARAKSWRITGDGFDALAAGLEKTWAEARKRMEPALADPTDEAVHQWRKRVKDHWYQARLLAPIWPEAMEPHIATADRLGEALGDHHDLAVLAGVLKGLNTRPAKSVAALARKRQKVLIRAAGVYARRLFADSAPCLTDRWRQWWQVWRA